METQLAIRADLAKAGDPLRAVQQQAYAKSAIPFHGVPLPQVREIARAHFSHLDLGSRREYENAVRYIWDHASHREERFAALTLAREACYAEYRDEHAFDLWAHLVTTGAWWDFCDEISVHLVGDSLQRSRPAVTPILYDWATEDHLWLRRVSILSQLSHKNSTDLDLLTYGIEANLEDKTFWLRKAIGWALREYGKTDPQWVLTKVAAYGDKLSPLSRREALKHLQKED